MTKMFEKLLRPFFKIKSNLSREESHSSKIRISFQIIKKLLKSSTKSWVMSKPQIFPKTHITFLEHLKLTQSFNLVKSVQTPKYNKIKQRMSNLNCTFSFKFITKEKFSKHKAISQSHTATRHSYERIIMRSSQVYHNFNNLLFRTFSLTV